MMGFSNGHSTRWLLLSTVTIHVQLKFGMFVFMKGGNRRTRRKTGGPAGKPKDPWENRRTRRKTLNQQKAQPTCDTSSGNWTQAAVEILDFPAHTS